jgi:signal transduction histidine kinase
MEPIPWIRGDSTHLRRVFDNLVSNAFKFTLPGGSITLRLRAEGKDVRMEVMDSGEGIPEDKLNRIFERFYQVEGGSARRHKGTGLGLALVKEIVEAHRGSVTVKSELGQGTTFTILIPGFFPQQNSDS